MPVINKKTQSIPNGAIYVGRGSKWGNPFIIGQHGNRDEVCDKHRQYLWNQVQAGAIALEELAALQNKTLVCFCAPLRCHADTLLKAADWAAKQISDRTQTTGETNE